MKTLATPDKHSLSRRWITCQAAEVFVPHDVFADILRRINRVAEEAGPPSGAVGTLISTLADLNPPAGGQDNVTDIDSGAQTGVAITGADTANGTWLYSIDGGSNWFALGSVSNSSARVLAADANTRVYFEPNADYSGSIPSALTLRAWDRSDFLANATAFVAAQERKRCQHDRFHNP